MTTATPRNSNAIGIVVNAIAVAAAIAAFPLLLLPTLKLGFAALLAAGPIAIVLFVVAVVVINIGPFIGLAAAISGRSRALPMITAALSLVGLVITVVVVQLAGAQIDLDNDGRAHGAAPDQCKPASPDGSAVGRACNEQGGPAPEGDCPAGYFCQVAVQGRPQTTCRLYCRHDCECPDNLECKHSYCAR